MKYHFNRLCWVLWTRHHPPSWPSQPLLAWLGLCACLGVGLIWGWHPLATLGLVVLGVTAITTTTRWLRLYRQDRPRRYMVRRNIKAFDAKFNHLSHRHPTLKTADSLVALVKKPGQRQLCQFRHTDLEKVWLLPQHTGLVPVRIVTLQGTIASYMVHLARFSWRDNGLDGSYDWEVLPAASSPSPPSHQQALFEATWLTVRELDALATLLRATS